MHLEGYGCAGATATAYGLACLELEAGDSGIRSLVSVQGSLAMFAIWRWGSEEQKQEWLPRMAAGEAIGCFGLTEPDAGSDPGAMRTRARRDGDDWILHGQKMWITNGIVSDVAVVWAMTDEGVRGFVVPQRHAGLHDAGHPQEAVACARRSRASCCSTTSACPASAMLPEATSAARPAVAASTRRASGSSSAPSAPRAPASRPRWTTAWSASRSAGRSPAPRSSRPSSPRWRSKVNQRHACSPCTSAG